MNIRKIAGYVVSLLLLPLLLVAAVEIDGRLQIASIQSISTSITPGTAAANLGKAEDAAGSSGDTGVAVLVQRQDTAVSRASADGDYVVPAADAYAVTYVRSDHPNRVLCTLTTTATTATVVTGCSAPGAGLAIYVTDFSIYGGVATSATAAATITSGTGGTCGTGTVTLDYCQHVATSGCVEDNSTPARGVTNGEICITDATVGTKFVVIKGFIAP